MAVSIAIDTGTEMSAPMPATGQASPVVALDEFKAYRDAQKGKGGGDVTDPKSLLPGAACAWHSPGFR
jgi:hypothetical protein